MDFIKKVYMATTILESTGRKMHSLHMSRKEIAKIVITDENVVIDDTDHIALVRKVAADLIQIMVDAAEAADLTVLTEIAAKAEILTEVLQVIILRAQTARGVRVPVTDVEGVEQVVEVRAVRAHLHPPQVLQVLPRTVQTL